MSLVKLNPNVTIQLQVRLPAAANVEQEMQSLANRLHVRAWVVLESIKWEVAKRNAAFRDYHIVNVELRTSVGNLGAVQDVLTLVPEAA